MPQPSLLVDRQADVVRLHFNRPEVLNALDETLAQSLCDALRKLADDSTVRVIVLGGSGRAFMAGGDLAALRADPVGVANRLIEPLHESIRLLTEMPIPVIACVQGVVAGAGLSLLLAADLVVVSDDARFSFAYTDIGTSCDGGASWSLPRVVGLRRALEVALLCERLTAAEALQMGLVTRVVPLAALNEVVMGMARRLAGREAVALAHLKRLIRSSSQKDLLEQLAAEQLAFNDCARRPEFISAIDRFYDQRRQRSE
jgi:2-(1,2-epoxy-1,2-dihydrophenyl)acetyl-CoA isomerase